MQKHQRPEYFCTDIQVAKVFLPEGHGTNTTNMLQLSSCVLLYKTILRLF